MPGGGFKRFIANLPLGCGLAGQIFRYLFADFPLECAYRHSFCDLLAVACAHQLVTWCPLGVSTLSITNLLLALKLQLDVCFHCLPAVSLHSCCLWGQLAPYPNHRQIAVWLSGQFHLNSLFGCTRHFCWITSPTCCLPMTTNCKPSGLHLHQASRMSMAAKLSVGIAAAVARRCAGVYGTCCYASFVSTNHAGLR